MQQQVSNFVIIISFEELRPYAYRYRNTNITIGTLDTVAATMLCRLCIVECYTGSTHSLYVSHTHLSTHALLAVEWIVCLFCTGQVPNSTAAKQTCSAD